MCGAAVVLSAVLLAQSQLVAIRSCCILRRLYVAPVSDIFCPPRERPNFPFSELIAAEFCLSASPYKYVPIRIRRLASRRPFVAGRHFCS